LIVAFCNRKLRPLIQPAAGGRLPGKIYLRAPDAMKSYVAGAFDAEIRKPNPPKNKPKH
jgi:hypothetical protein